MVTRQSSPNFFLRYQALIRPPGPPPTIARSSIDFCYLPAKLRRPDRHATCPRLRIACQTERGAERQKSHPAPEIQSANSTFSAAKGANSASGDSHLSFSRSAFVPERKMNNRRRSEIEAKRPAAAKEAKPGRHFAAQNVWRT